MTVRIRIAGRTFSLLLTVFLILTGSAMGCGPGRRFSIIRPGRKTTPLVFKQHIPNLSEFTLAASGVAEGKISRSDPKFRDLVRNENGDIIFKDEEGTGADRMMTQRCKDKLNTLAISVMNQWQGVKLRVTEAWDEEMHHAKDSLHYEGRAVDITTSDRDRSKYGMLARLAVQAGFDWVYYENRAHIHCSVKSDSSMATKNGGCFPPTSRVKLESGALKPLSELSVGDRVLSLSTDGNLVYDDVMMFFHRDADQMTSFVEIETESGQRIQLTPNHLIHVSQSGDIPVSDVKPRFARRVQSGEFLFTADSQLSLKSERIVNVKNKIARGVVAPLTRRGTIVIDDIITSCYAVIESENIAHAVFAPVRFWYSVSDWLRFETHLETGNSQHNLTEGVWSKDYHWYAQFLYTLAPYVLPDAWLVHS